MEHYNEHLIAGIAIARDTRAKDKRQAGTKRKRATQEYHDPPWTASRCNRLIRTITSRISILQKLSAANRLHVTPNAKAVASHAAEVRKAGAAGPNLGTPSKDPEWVPATNTSTAEIKTYTGRTKKQCSAGDKARASNATDQPHIGLPTPLVRRMLRTQESSLSSDNSDFQNDLPHEPAARSRPRAKLRSRQLPVKPNSLRDEAHTNLVSALESFLLGTDTSPPKPRVGASSLMSACLRRVPDYIQLEQASLEEESSNDDQSDNTAADEIYAELENLGTGAGNGWSGLREVVRADGIQKICEAIKRNLIPVRVIDRLVAVCSKCSAPREAQSLVSTALLTFRRTGSPSGLNFLYSYPGGSESDRYCLRMTRELLENGKLTVDEVFGQQELSRIVMRSMAQPGDIAEAVALVHHCLRTMRDRPNQPERDAVAQKAQAFLERLAIVLTAVAFAGRHKHAQDQVICSVLNAVHSIAAQEHLECATTHRSMVRSYSSGFLLGSFTLLAGDSNLSKSLQHPTPQELLQDISKARAAKVTGQAKKYQLIGDDFLSQIGMCLGKWTGEAGHTFLRETSLQFLEIASHSDAQSAELLRALALNNAAAYGDIVSDKASILIAEEIESLVLQDLPSIKARTPKPTQQISEKYRWEDGLCEWILKTPLLPGPNHVKAVAEHGVYDEDILGLSHIFRDAKNKRARIKTHRDWKGEKVKTQQQTRRGSNATTPGVHTSAEQETAIESSDSECDELAMSIKKPGRPQELPGKRQASVFTTKTQEKSQTAAYRAFKGFRNSSGSSNLDTGYFSDDDL